MARSLLITLLHIKMSVVQCVLFPTLSQLCRQEMEFCVIVHAHSSTIQFMLHIIVQLVLLHQLQDILYCMIREVVIESNTLLLVQIVQLTQAVSKCVNHRFACKIVHHYMLSRQLDMSAATRAIMVFYQILFTCV
jgi:hypothetical protein